MHANMTSSIEFGSIEIDTTSSIELDSNSTVRGLNFVDEVLIAALYADRPLIAVPWLQLISSLAQVASLLALMTVLLWERRRARSMTVASSWVQLDQVATPSRSDAVLKAFLLVSAVAFAFSATVLLLLCLPIVHVGAFAGAAYVGQGVVDMLPLLWSVQDEPGFGAAMALRAALLLGAVAIVRVVAVLGRPPLMAFTPGASVRRAAACAQPTSPTRFPSTCTPPIPLTCLHHLPWRPSAEPLHLRAERLRDVRPPRHTGRLRAALRCEPNPNPDPDPDPSPNPSPSPNPNPSPSPNPSPGAARGPPQVLGPLLGGR